MRNLVEVSLIFRYWLGTFQLATAAVTLSKAALCLIYFDMTFISARFTVFQTRRVRIAFTFPFCQVIHEFNRAQLIDDALDLAR